MSNLITRIITIRHAETDWNVQRRIQGHYDSAFTKHGMDQIEATVACLASETIHLVYSSDLLRARLTAQPIAVSHSLDVIEESELRERQFGIFEGLTHHEIRHRYPYSWLMHRSGDPDYVIPSGESPRAFFERVTAAFHLIAEGNVGKTVVVVTHGGVLMMLNRFVNGLAPQSSAPLTDNATMNTLNYDPQSGWEVLSWNDNTHLA